MKMEVYGTVVSLEEFLIKKNGNTFRLNMEISYHFIQMEAKKKKVFTMKIEKMVNGLAGTGMGIK